MTDHAALVSRRALLAAGLGGVALASACTTRRHQPAADPDAVALEAARAAELSLLAAHPEGTSAYAVHLAHLHALGGAVPTATATPPSGATVTSTEGSTVAPLLDAARHARRGDTAAVLASVAASHAVMSGVRPR